MEECYKQCMKIVVGSLLLCLPRDLLPGFSFALLQTHTSSEQGPSTLFPIFGSCPDLLSGRGWTSGECAGCAYVRSGAVLPCVD